MRMKQQVLLLILTLCTQISLATESGAETAPALVKALQSGGYIIYLRHAATDHHQKDIDLSDLSRCDLQRNLSEQGKTETHQFKQALAKLNIPIGSVLTSPYCRCIDTAAIAFDQYRVEPDLRATFVAGPEESRYLVQRLGAMLSEQPHVDTNTVLVGHTANLQELAKIWPKPEGVAHIFKPLGPGAGFKHLGNIKPTDWIRLVQP